MKKNVIRNKLLLGLVIITLLIIVGYKLNSRQKQNSSIVSTQELNLKRIKDLTENSLSSAGYPDEKSTNDARKEICQLTARTETDREKAIAAIRDFLDNPKVEVTYQCSDAFYDTTNDKLVSARSETYKVGLNTFLVNPLTNHVIQANMLDFAASSKTYTATEVETLAKEFITKHETALGTINLDTYSYEHNQKGSKDANYFFVWKGTKQTVTLDPPAVTCSKDITKDTKDIYYQADGTPCYKTYEQTRQPEIQVAFNNHGQLLNFANSFEGEIGREISF